MESPSINIWQLSNFQNSSPSLQHDQHQFHGATSFVLSPNHPKWWREKAILMTAKSMASNDHVLSISILCHSFTAFAFKMIIIKCSLVHCVGAEAFLMMMDNLSWHHSNSEYANYRLHSHCLEKKIQLSNWNNFWVSSPFCSFLLHSACEQCCLTFIWYSFMKYWILEFNLQRATRGFQKYCEASGRACHGVTRGTTWNDVC